MAKQKMIVNAPDGSLFYGNGFVYINVESVYDPEVKYTRNKRVCIGKSIDKKTMYANDKYIALFAKDSLPEPPERSDTLSMGMPLFLKKAACDSGLDSSLLSAFNPDETNLILDLAAYLLTEETDAFQHYPSYGFHNALLSESIVSDSTISRFLREGVNPTAVQEFLDEWSEQNAGEGRAYLCYDSTNINCVAEGVTLAEMGHAKDDPSKPQVNLEYVVRQKDGLPLIYRNYPGSIVDITQCSDMIETIQALGYRDIVAICDRGYISKDNLVDFDCAGIGFLLLLKICDATRDLIVKYGKKIRLRSEAYMEEHDLYGMTVRHRLFGNTGPCRYLHIVWDQEIADKERRSIMKTVSGIEASLSKMVKKGTHLSDQNQKEYEKYFDIEIYPRTRKIKSYERNSRAIDDAIELEGFHILVSSDEMTCSEAVDAYSKRDCVEKTFRALKTNTGMDALRGHSNANIDGRFFIMFIASILRSVVFYASRRLRDKDRKNYTVSAIVKELNKIEAVADYKTGQYSRRYKLTAKQKAILSCLALSENDVDEFAQSISSSYKS